MEVCELCKSSHLTMASQLLEAGVLCLREETALFLRALSDSIFPSSQVDPKALESGLTQRSVSTIKETVSKSLTKAQAVDGRDAFVKVSCFSVDEQTLQRTN